MQAGDSAYPKEALDLQNCCIYNEHTIGDPHAVSTPFGACCTHSIGWPQVYERRGEKRAVLGGFDPSARKFLKTDELTFSMPVSLYKTLLDKMEMSALTRHTWQNDLKKVRKSQRAWGEAVKE